LIYNYENRAGAEAAQVQRPGEIGFPAFFDLLKQHIIKRRGYLK
jgi:hypothetical protein